ncbi:membrane protein insertase YidC [Streptomyces olivoreticuli]|uniref:YidC/Oxa1 family membrane protein insertase n=1 Tax=Streptomyces olivoreticuli TaxID=68246 RepID=UPI002659F2CE|nr:membrane protein insertase YidC [Streptomyces olivoreticuli]WKK21726.1 membrane protein insertase YidC [Streptomyces olivoreticuli]
MSTFASLPLSWLTGLIDPLFGASATAVAIVLFTLGVRLALHPLARSAARGQRAKAELAPRMAELRRKHKSDPERLMRAMREAHAKAGVSPMAGLLPSLAQLPVLFVMYHLFSGGASDLLDHTLLGARLGGHWTDAPFGAQGLVYAALFVVVAAVATWTYVRSRRTPMPTSAEVLGLTKFLPLLSFGTLITVAVVPLAAGLYLATSTAWTAAERAYLARGLPASPPAA